jgi:hypothetical protein
MRYRGNDFLIEPKRSLAVLMHVACHFCAGQKRPADVYSEVTQKQ